MFVAFYDKQLNTLQYYCICTIDKNSSVSFSKKQSYVNGFSVNERDLPRMIEL